MLLFIQKNKLKEEEKTMAFIGIDLGTTTSEACIYQDGNPKMIPDLWGKEIIDSVVGVDPSTREIIVGEKANRLLIEHPEDTISQIKRDMGQDIKKKLGNKELNPEEVSALILKYIKKYSEEFLGEEIARAVITVPANFNDLQRNATKKAGELAGFQVERIINEPTAAAMAYGIDKQNLKAHVMVYDLGGGTFDVTILEYHDNILDVKSSAGDNKLGGKDFDEMLVKHVADKFKEDNDVDLHEDRTALNRLTEACEKAKKELSVVKQTSINLPFIATKDNKPLALQFDISRDLFESLIKEKIDRTEKAINKALKDSKIEKEEIDTILLVGGSTRIPYVKELVKRVMGKDPKADIDPDLAVSRGAAIQAAIIDGQEGPIIMDVVALTLGTEVVGNLGGKLVPGLFDPIIPANSPVLKEFSKQYRTVSDNQTEVNIRVYQQDSLNDSMWAKDHTLLPVSEGQSAILSGIPAAPAGQEAVTIKFFYNSNGLLDVTGIVDSTGEEIKFNVRTTSTGQVTTTNIDELWKNSEKANKVKTTVQIAEKRLKEIGENADLEEKIKQLKKAVLDGDDDRITELDDEINELLFELE